MKNAEIRRIMYERIYFLVGKIMYYYVMLSWRLCVMTLCKIFENYNFFFKCNNIFIFRKNKNVDLHLDILFICKHSMLSVLYINAIAM